MQATRRMTLSSFRSGLNGRAVRLAIGAGVLGTIGVVLAVSVGLGQFHVVALAGVLAALPLVVYAAMRWPYVVPYALYALLVPLDDVLTIPGGGTLPRVLGLASVGAIALYTVRKRRLSSPPLALYLILAFFLWVLLEMTRSPDLDQAARTAQTFLLLVTLYAVTAVAPITEAQFRTICASIVAGGVVASLYGIYLFHQHPEMVAHAVGRLTITMNGRILDPNDFADALLAPFAFALVGLLHARRPAHLMLWFAAVALILTAILASLSREALLALVLVVAVLVWFSRRRAIGFGLGLAATAAVPLLFPAILARMSDGLSTGGAGRTSIWHVDVKAFLQHPILGWGTGGSIHAYDRNYLSVFQPYIAGWSRPPHNTLLFLGVELGVVGMLLFFAALVASLRPLADVKRGDPLYDLRVALTASAAALLVAATFVDLSPAKHFWLIFAATAQFRTVVRSRR